MRMTISGLSLSAGMLTTEGSLWVLGRDINNKYNAQSQLLQPSGSTHSWLVDLVLSRETAGTRNTFHLLLPLGNSPLSWKRQSG